MAIDPSLIFELKNNLSPAVRVRESVSADSITTFGVGGEIGVLLEALSLKGAQETIQRVSDIGIANYRLLGAGSNLVIPDSGITDPVIQLGREFSEFIICRNQPEKITVESFDTKAAISAGRLDIVSLEDLGSLNLGSSVWVTAFASCPLMGLSRKMTQCGFSGLEFAAGIPGLAGGAVAMNAGAHGHELSEILRRVYVLDKEGHYHVLTPKDLQIKYRSSGLPNGALVVAVELELTVKEVSECMTERNRCLEYRKKTQPLHLPSAGSVFKNPSPDKLSEDNIAGGVQPAAGWLLEQAGMKGKRLGGVAFSDLHANWLVRVGEHGSAHDAVSLIELGRKEVLDRFGITLELELKLW